MPGLKTQIDKHRPLRERTPFRQCHEFKIWLARHLLVTIEPDMQRVIDETVKQAIAEKSQDWEIALLSIQAEIAEEFEGGLLHGVPSVASLCSKIRSETRSWKLQDTRERKLIRELDIENKGQILPRVRELVQTDFKREREKAIFDDAFGTLKRAKNATNESLVLFYELQRSFELEDQIRNKLDFEGRN